MRSTSSDCITIKVTGESVEDNDSQSEMRLNRADSLSESNVANLIELDDDVSN